MESRIVATVLSGLKDPVSIAPLAGQTPSVGATCSAPGRFTRSRGPRRLLHRRRWYARPDPGSFVTVDSGSATIKLPAQVCIAQPFRDFNVQKAVVGGIGPRLHSPISNPLTVASTPSRKKLSTSAKSSHPRGVSTAEMGARGSTTRLALRS